MSHALDCALLRAARTAGHTPAAEVAVRRFSRLGEHGAVWQAIGAVGIVMDRRRRPSWRRATAIVAGAYGLNTLVKVLVHRPRPQIAGLPPLTGTPTGLSFPSAHATTSFAAAGLYRRMGLPCGVPYALAVALAASRLYLGVHYPSDVLAGAALGHAVASATGARVAP